MCEVIPRRWLGPIGDVSTTAPNPLFENSSILSEDRSDRRGTSIGWCEDDGHAPRSRTTRNAAPAAHHTRHAQLQRTLECYSPLNSPNTHCCGTRRFVTKGKATTTLKKGAKRLSNDACFSLAAEGKVLDLAVPSTVPDDGKSGQVRLLSHVTQPK